MSSSTSGTLSATDAVAFTLQDGRKGLVAPEARKTYDHIVRSRVGPITSGDFAGRYYSEVDSPADRLRGPNSAHLWSIEALR